MPQEPYAILSGATISPSRGAERYSIQLELAGASVKGRGDASKVFTENPALMGTGMNAKRLAATVLQWVNGRWNNSPLIPFERVLPYLALADAAEPVAQAVTPLISARASVNMETVIASLRRILNDEAEVPKLISQATDEYCNAVLDGSESLLTTGGMVSGSEALNFMSNTKGPAMLGSAGEIGRFLREVLGVDQNTADRVAAVAAKIDLSQRLFDTANHRGIVWEGKPENTSSAAALPEPSSAKAVSAAFALGLAAARVEMWASEALSEERKTQMRGFSPQLRVQVEKAVNELTAALDRIPPEMAEVRNRLAAMARPLLEIVKTVNFGSERLRTGVAASVTYAAMVGEHSKDIDPAVAKIFGGEHAPEFQRVLAAGQTIIPSNASR